MTLLFGGVLSFVFGDLIGQGKEEGEDERNNRLLRPPGAQEEAVFLATCLRCGKCAHVCPHKAIKIARGEQGLSLGTPYIVPREAPCQLCPGLDCTKACPSGSLLPLEDKAKVRMGTAEFDKEQCVAWKQGDECKVCYTSCPFYDKAIKLEDHKLPYVDTDVCTGCGICEYVCINNTPSISVKPRG